MLIRRDETLTDDKQLLAILVARFCETRMVSTGLLSPHYMQDWAVAFFWNPALTVSSPLLATTRSSRLGPSFRKNRGNPF